MHVAECSRNGQPKLSSHIKRKLPAGRRTGIARTRQTPLIILLSEKDGERNFRPLCLRNLHVGILHLLRLSCVVLIVLLTLYRPSSFVVRRREKLIITMERPQWNSISGQKSAREPSSSREIRRNKFCAGEIFRNWKKFSMGAESVDVVFFRRVVLQWRRIIIARSVGVAE